MNTDFYKGWTTPAKLAFDNVYGIAAGLGAVAITPLYYIGAIAGTEFLTYNVNKLYFALEIEINGGALSSVAHTLILYDEANAAVFTLSNITAYWDATAAAFRAYCNTLLSKNNYFSRVVATQITQIKFNGYRLDITP